MAAIDDAEAIHIEAVLRACRNIGYGRVMQVASEAWRDIDPIGAISLGPCFGSLPSPSAGSVPPKDAPSHPALTDLLEQARSLYTMLLQTEEVDLYEPMRRLARGLVELRAALGRAER